MEQFQKMINEHCGGDGMFFAKEYYRQLPWLADSADCDIIGHFDLITKFNGQIPLFNEDNDTYKTSAIKSLDRILDSKPDILFEVNTGAMYRKGNPKPYPAEFMMKHICKRGGLITISSDSHCCESLDFAFEKMIDYCKNCGFAEAYYLTSQGRKKYNL